MLGRLRLRVLWPDGPGLASEDPNTNATVILASFGATKPDGYALARALNVGIGDKGPMRLAQGKVTPAGLLPRSRSFTVSGIFEAGHMDFDAALSFIHVEDAQRMERLPAPMGLRLRIDDMHQAPLVAAELKQSMPGSLEMRDWSKLNANWFAAVQTEKKMMFIILTLIIAVAAFNLVSTLVMTVTDKQADIAILRTLGASPRSIMKIFMVQGALVGILGTLLGVGGGVLVALNLDTLVPEELATRFDIEPFFEGVFPDPPRESDENLRSPPASEEKVWVPRALRHP